MKKTLLISLLSIASIGAYAQSNLGCKVDPNMPANAVPAWPSSPYVSEQDNPECAPCYTYTSKHGVKIMECPFLQFIPQQAANNMAAVTPVPQTGALDVQNVNTYTGNYPKACRRDPDMPKGAVPAWPQVTPYVSLTAPGCAPCYTYTSKHGIAIMECPFLYFMPENTASTK